MGIFHMAATAPLEWKWGAEAGIPIFFLKPAGLGAPASPRVSVFGGLRVPGSEAAELPLPLSREPDLAAAIFITLLPRRVFLLTDWNLLVWLLYQRAEVVSFLFFFLGWFHAVLRRIPSGLWAWIFKSPAHLMSGALLPPRWNGAIAFRSHSEERAGGGEGRDDDMLGSPGFRGGKATSRVWGQF